MLATEVIYEAENGLLPEVDVATASNPASPVAANGTAAYAPLRSQWLQAREELAVQVAVADTAYQNHPGLKEWENYVASESCKAMMVRLNTVVYDDLNWALAHHWHQLWPGKEAKAIVRDFKAKARAEVLIPTLMNPSENAPLLAVVISRESRTVSSHKQQFENFKATDPRFPLDKPVIFLSWDTSTPWSIIVPGTGFWQLDTFVYTDENGGAYDSEQVISEVYYKSLQKSEFQNDFIALDSSYARLTKHGALYTNLNRLQRQVNTLDKKISAWSKVSLPEPKLIELTRRAEMFAKSDPAAPRGLLLTGPSGTGKTLIACSLAASLNANFQKLSLSPISSSRTSEQAASACARSGTTPGRTNRL